MTRIPKKIHYCWFGGGKKPKKVLDCIKSWQKYCSGYEIIEWNEQNFDIKINKYVEEAYKAGRFAFVADYVRCYVINKYGGVYFDTDVELIKSIDELLKYDAFFASEDNVHINTGLGFGSRPNNKLLKAILKDYDGLDFYGMNGKTDLLTCPIRNTRVIKSIYSNLEFKKKVIKIDNMVFLSKEYFCPLDYETKEMNITDNTYGIHWFSESWRKPSEKVKHRLKKTIKKIVGWR